MTDNKTDINNYEENYEILQESLKIVQSKDSTLADVILALENGVKAHANLELILQEAEAKIEEILIKTSGKDTDIDEF